jgi:hypothetical protein
MLWWNADEVKRQAGSIYKAAHAMALNRITIIVNQNPAGQQPYHGASLAQSSKTPGLGCRAGTTSRLS